MGSGSLPSWAFQGPDDLGREHRGLAVRDQHAWQRAPQLQVHTNQAPITSLPLGPEQRRLLPSTSQRLSSRTLKAPSLVEMK